MTEKTISNEAAIIDEILRRKGLPQKRVPAEKMAIFKTRIAEEIARCGRLDEAFVNDLLRQLKNGEL